MTTAKEIGERLKARRERLEITQGDLAESLGVASNTVSRYEAGKIAISSPELQRVAHLLGVRVSYFYGETEEKSSQEIVYEPIMDELRAASYSGVLDDDMAEEIAEDIRVKARRRARKQGRA